MTFASFHHLLQGKYLELQNRGQHIALGFHMLNSWSLFDFLCMYIWVFSAEIWQSLIFNFLTFGHLELSSASVTHVSCVKWSSAASRGQTQLSSLHSAISKATFRLPWVNQVAVCSAGYWEMPWCFLSTEGAWCEDVWDFWVKLLHPVDFQFCFYPG